MDERSLSPARILVVHERYQQAGGEDGVFDAHLAMLRAHGHEVATLVVDNDEIDERISALGRVTLAVDTVWSRRGVARVREAVRAFRPEVLHAHNTFPLLSPAIHGAARAEGVATVQTLHNYRLICPSAVLFRDGRPCHDCVGRSIAWPGVLHACYRDSRPATLAVAAMQTVHRARGTWHRDVDAFIVLARSARDLLAQGGIPTARVSVVPNTVVDTTLHDVGPGEGFLFVGRLTEDKGVATLLAAWERLPRGIGLAIAGSGPLDSLVRAAASRNPDIRVLGRLERGEVDIELARCRALVVPSLLYENCPLTVLEAFAAGRPVIGSGHGGIADLVEDGLTGRLVRPGDVAALASAVLEAQADPTAMARAGEAARSAYEERYTPEVGYVRLMEVYRAARDHRMRTTAT